MGRLLVLLAVLAVLVLGASGHNGTATNEIAPTGCGACRKREEVKYRSLMLIRDELLQRLGFETVPNMTGRVLPQIEPQEIMRVTGNAYSLEIMQGDEPRDAPSPRDPPPPGAPPHPPAGFVEGRFTVEEEDNFHVKTEKIITFAQPHPHLRHHSHVLYFKFSEEIRKHQIQQATLFLYMRGTGAQQQPMTVQVEIYQIYETADQMMHQQQSAQQQQPGQMKRSSAIIARPQGVGDWVQINVTLMVKDWFNNPKRNWGLTLNTTFEGKRIILVDTAAAGQGSKVPFIEVITEKRKRRTKRTPGLNCNEQTEQSVCCRYPLTVDFEEFGWDFIIAPKRYEAFYCSGECPMLTLQKNTHTHLIKIADPKSAGPCCAPRKMSSIDMLYFDQDLNFVYGKLPGMVVDRCGCS